MDDLLEEQRRGAELRARDAERAAADVARDAFLVTTLLPTSLVHRVLHCRLTASRAVSHTLIVKHRAIDVYQVTSTITISDPTIDNDRENEAVMVKVGEFAMIGLIRDAAIIANARHGGDVIAVTSDAGHLSMLRYQASPSPMFVQVASIEVSGSGLNRMSVGHSIRVSYNDRHEPRAILLTSLHHDITILTITPHYASADNDSDSESMTDDSDEKVHVSQSQIIQSLSVDRKVNCRMSGTVLTSAIIHDGDVRHLRIVVAYCQSPSQAHTTGYHPHNDKSSPLSSRSNSVTADTITNVAASDLRRRHSTPTVPSQLQSLSKESQHSLMHLTLLEHDLTTHRSKLHPLKFLCQSEVVIESLRQFQDSSLVLVFTSARLHFIDLRNASSLLPSQSQSPPYSVSVPYPVAGSVVDSVRIDDQRLLCMFEDGSLYQLVVDIDALSSSSPSPSQSLSTSNESKQPFCSWVNQSSSLIDGASNPHSLTLVTASSCRYLLIAYHDSDTMLYQLTISDQQLSLSLCQSVTQVAPVFDCCVADPNDGHQSQLFAASGVGNSGCIRVIDFGVGVETLASSSSPDYAHLTAMIPIKHSHSARYHSLLLCSFLTSTRILTLSDELADVSDRVRIASEVRTICAGFVCASRVLLQVIETGLRCIATSNGGSQSVMELFDGSNAIIDIALSHLLPLEPTVSRIAQAIIVDDYVLLSILPSNTVVVVAMDFSCGSVRPVTVNTDTVSADVSCLTIVDQLCLVATHDSILTVFTAQPQSASVSVSLADCLPSQSSMSVSQSICIVESMTVMHHSTFALLALGLRDGTLLTFRLPPVSQLTQRSLIQSLTSQKPTIKKLGILPVQLHPLPSSSSSSSPSLVARSNRLWLLSLTAETQSLSSVLIADSTRYDIIASFASPLSMASIACVVDNRMLILRLNPPPSQSQSRSVSVIEGRVQLQISIHTIPLRATPRLVHYHSPTRNLVVITSDYDGQVRHSKLLVVTVRQTSNDADTDSDGERGRVVSEWQGFAALEQPLAVSAITIDHHHYILVATAINLRGQTSTKGRLLVMTVNSDGAISVVCEAHLPDGVTAVAPYHQSQLVACAGSTVYLLSFDSQSSITPLCKFECRYSILGLSVSGDDIAVSVVKDGIQLLAVEQPEPPTEGEEKSEAVVTVRMRLRHSDPAPRAARQVCLTQSTAPIPPILLPSASPSQSVSVRHCVISDDNGQLTVLRVDPLLSVTPPPLEPSSLSQHTLQLESLCHIGGIAAKILPGNFVYHLTDTDRVNGSDSDRTLLLVTLSGELLALTRLDRSEAKLLSSVQSSLSLHTSNISLLGHDIQRYRRRGTLNGVRCSDDVSRSARMKMEECRMLDGDRLLALERMSGSERDSLLRETGVTVDELRSCLLSVQRRVFPV